MEARRPIVEAIEAFEASLNIYKNYLRAPDNQPKTKMGMIVDIETVQFELLKQIEVIRGIIAHIKKFSTQPDIAAENTLKLINEVNNLQIDLNRYKYKAENPHAAIRFNSDDKKYVDKIYDAFNSFKILEASDEVKAAYSQTFPIHDLATRLCVFLGRIDTIGHELEREWLKTEILKVCNRPPFGADDQNNGKQTSIVNRLLDCYRILISEGRSGERSKLRDALQSILEDRKTISPQLTEIAERRARSFLVVVHDILSDENFWRQQNNPTKIPKLKTLINNKESPVEIWAKVCAGAKQSSGKSHGLFNKGPDRTQATSDFYKAIGSGRVDKLKEFLRTYRSELNSRMIENFEKANGSLQPPPSPKRD